MSTTPSQEQERLMGIILAPRVTEKAAYIGQHRQYIFKIMDTATKTDVKQAVELMFKVKVDAVQVARTKRKLKRFGRVEGYRKAWKKAYVKLAEGQKIELGTA